MRTILYNYYKWKIYYPVLGNLGKLILGNRNRYNPACKTPNVFFIIGSGRNGSTLLGSRLNNHSQVFLPPEQWALHKTIQFWHYYRRKSWSDICLKIVNEFQRENANWSFDETDANKIIQELKQLEPDNRSFGMIYQTIYNHFGLKVGKEAIWFGDHSPLMTDYAKLIFKEFPNGKFIFLVRDPRAVVLSYSKMEGSRLEKPVNAAKKWNDSIKAYKWLKKRDKENLLLIKYEDLVSEPEKTMILISSFLNINYENPMISKEYKNSDPMHVSNYSHHQNLYKPIFKDSVEKWKNELSTAVIEEIKPIVKKNANWLSYQI